MICCKYQDLEGWKGNQLSRYPACNVSLLVANMSLYVEVKYPSCEVCRNFLIIWRISGADPEVEEGGGRDTDIELG